MTSYNKRVLVVSNNCFSLTNSNGRTLGNLFNGWPKENLAQICVIAKDPNWEICNNYYCIEDKKMLEAFIKLRKADGKILVQPTLSETAFTSSADTKRVNIGKKTVEKVALRELIWARKRWNSKSFNNWLDTFNPEAIVLQFGDSIFMIEIACYIATTKNIPLIIYNTEGYYFFPRNWHQRTKFDWMVFPIYRHIYRKAVEKLMRIANHSIYLNKMLKHDYDSVFGNSSTVIYNSSSIEWSNTPLFTGNKPQICYLGNLGLDRDSGLIEIGDVLNSINSEYKIQVYGYADKDTQDRFKSALGIEYKGLVSYDEVKNIITKSDILFHVETETGYKTRQLQYGFSTKIADSVASGKCFVVYAPEELACSQYIKNNGAGWTASTKDQLKAVLLDIFYNPEHRSKVLNCAKQLAIENHNSKTNATKFQQILTNVKI